MPCKVQRGSLWRVRESGVSDGDLAWMSVLLRGVRVCMNVLSDLTCNIQFITGASSRSERPMPANTLKNFATLRTV